MTPDKQRRHDGAIVEKITHPKTGRSADMRLRKISMTFSCRIGELSHTSKNGAEVREWALGILAKADGAETLLKWLPVIEVEFPDGYRYGYRKERDELKAQCSVSVNRYFVALAQKTPAGGEVWHRIEWDQGNPDSPACLEEEDRLGMSRVFRKPETRFGETSTGKFRLPEHDQGTYRIAFDPELWAALEQITKVIDSAGTQLSKMLKSKAGLAQLVAIAGGPSIFALPPGKEVQEPADTPR